MMKTRRSVIRFLLLLICSSSWLVASGHSTETEHVIYISIDGLRGDSLESILSVRADEFPNFNRLKNDGAATFRARTDYGFTETIPNHCSMITGRPVYEPGTATQLGEIGHGQINNTGAAVTGFTSVIHKLGGTGEFAYKSSVFDVVHEAGRSTVLFFSKNRLYFLVRSYNETFGADSTGVPGVVNPEPNKIDRSSPASGFPTGAIAVGDVFVTDANSNGLAAFTMLHFIDPDTSVHRSTVTTTAPANALSSYEVAIKSCDDALGTILGWLDTNPEGERTVIIISGDHGGVGGNSAHRDATRVENYTIPFFIHGAGFEAGTDSYDYFSNRTDPGADRSTDLLTSLPNPPLRNGDMANLSTTLLGLPTIPGSFFIPELIDPKANDLLKISQTATGSYEVSWPKSATGFQLESSTDMQEGNWLPVTENLTTNDDFNVHCSSQAAPDLFFRLRRK